MMTHTARMPPPPFRVVLGYVGAVMLLAWIVAHATGCPRPMTPQERAVVAESTFSAEMLACVEKSPTIEDSRACRRDVRAKWNVDGGAR